MRGDDALPLARRENRVEALRGRDRIRIGLDREVADRGSDGPALHRRHGREDLRPHLLVQLLFLVWRSVRRSAASPAAVLGSVGAARHRRPAPQLE